MGYAPIHEDRITIESPENVEVDVELAGVGSRFVAALIDGVFIAAMEFAIVLVGSAIASIPMSMDGWMRSVGSLGMAVVIGLMTLVLFGYYIACEMWMNGQSPGKRTMGVRVVKDNGQPIRFYESALRNFIRIFEAAAGFYMVSVVSILVTRRGKRLGDIAAGTIVARATGRTAPAHLSIDVSRLPIPHEMRQAVIMGIGRITQEEYEFVSGFLERAPRLHPPLANKMAVEVGWELMQKLGVTPAADAALTPAIYLAFLQAVAAVYVRKTLGA